jgi:YHS domain-containing protein
VFGLVRTFLLFLLMLVLARALMRFFGGVIQGASADRHPGSGAGSGSPPVTRMVQDPVCGTYVVPGKAIALARGGATTFFCSEACRQKYLERAPGRS